jgi:hypothetical protein
MGWQAVEVLSGLLEDQPRETQRLLTCEPVAGTTLTAARA